MYNKWRADEDQITKTLNVKLGFKKRVLWKGQKSILQELFNGLKFLQLLSFNFVECKLKFNFC